MNIKLTLNLDESVISQAKIYAKENSISLSNLIENYLDFLTSKNNKKSKVSPLVESLTGVIDGENIEDKNYYKNYLPKKYLFWKSFL